MLSAVVLSIDVCVGSSYLIAADFAAAWLHGCYEWKDTGVCWFRFTLAFLPFVSSKAELR